MVAIPDGFAQINWKFTGTSVPNGAEVTMGVAIGTFTGTPEDAADAAGVVWNDEILPGQSNTITLSSVLCKFGPTATGPSGEVAFGVAGGQSQVPEAPQVAALVQKRTGLGGRAGRGRMFVPGLGENLVLAGGIFSPTVIASYQAAYDALLAGLATADLIPVVLHGAGSPLSTPTVITSLQLMPLVATQRRRLRP